MTKPGNRRPRSLAARVRAAGGGLRNPYATDLAKCRWWLTLDPDLVELLSAEGSPVERVFGLASLRARARRQRTVVSIPLTDAQFRDLRPLIDRLGAEVRYSPPHPNAKREEIAHRLRRKAG